MPKLRNIIASKGREQKVQVQRRRGVAGASNPIGQSGPSRGEVPQDRIPEQDYSGRYNTQLKPDQERAYQQWAASNNRQRDVYDYDMRGAWQEMQSGSASPDERGHFTDRYKKPNHITFSAESQYHSRENPGGAWTQNPDGSSSYTPSDYVLRNHSAEELRKYFDRNERGNGLVLPGRIARGSKPRL